jgi:hypothetical protein
MMITLLTLCVAQGGSDFGWNKPAWNHSNLGVYPDRNKQIEDVTGDGVGEFVTTYSAGSGTVVEVLNGADGTLWVPVDAPGDRYYQHHYFADLDGDGLDDVVLGSDFNGKILVVNGISGQPIWNTDAKRHRFWTQTPDWNSDGIGDLIIGGRGHITALSGATGAVIWNTQNHILEQPNQWQAEISDFNGDGIGDILLSHPKGDYASNSRCGVMEVRNGLTGDLLWASAGSANQRFGENLHLDDVNNDGIADVMTSYGDRATVLSGRDGAILWDRELGFGLPGDILEFIVDLSADGVDDLIFQYHSVIGDGYVLEAWDGISGNTLWQATTQGSGESFGDIEAIDLDQDGGLDLFCSNSQAEIAGHWVGMVRAIHGQSGIDLWRLYGGGERQIGNLVMKREVDGIPGVDIILGSTGSGHPRFRMALNGATGQVVWQRDYSSPEWNHVEWYQADVDGDGQQDILERQHNNSSSTPKSTLLSISAETGQLVCQADFASPGIIEVFNSAYDLDGDGIDEVFLDRSVSFDLLDLAAFSTNDLGWVRGIRLSAEQLSVASGGTIDIDLEFPPEQAGWNYHLLLSENGTEPTNLNGLLVPLSPSYWLSSSYLGLYPDGMFTNPTGTLQADGTAHLQFLVLPGQIPASAVGQWMHAAVVSAEPGNAWEFSSGSVSVEVIP